MEIISGDDFEEGSEGFLQREVIYNANGFDGIDISKNRFSENNCRWVDFSSELKLVICNENFYNSLNLKYQQPHFSKLFSAFFLAGTRGMIFPRYFGLGANYQERVGNHYLYYQSDSQRVEQYFPDEHYHVFTLEIDLALLKTFATDIESLPKSLQLLLENDLTQPFYLPGSGITPEMQMILSQILNAPYQGILQRMYLECKVTELIVLQLANLKEREKDKQRFTSLKKGDIEKIYQAKEVLIRNCVEPPTLIKLAQQVGIHHMKLKHGFRQLFGTTMFGYLHDYRMEVARNLLLEDDMNVTTVANTVGYSHLGHFSAAFKRKFGMTPSECRLGKKIKVIQ
jgi:AraC family transcriptional regulator, transcriptional activator of the genes for pyochelin and ferripyochelin receptors